MALQAEIADNSKSINLLRDSWGGLQESVSDTVKEMRKGLDLKQGLKDALSSPFALAGISVFSFKGLISQAFGMMQEFSRRGDKLTGMSDAFGRLNTASSLFYGSGAKFAERGQVLAAMNSLVNQGINPAQKEMRGLTKLTADLTQISGASSESLGALFGNLNMFYKTNEQGARKVISGLLAVSQSGAQLNVMLSHLNKINESIMHLGTDGERSTKALADGLGRATKAFQSVGISAEKAGAFMEKVMNPENFGEMQGLMAKLNISTTEYFSMLESANGKEMFFDKLLTNLPQLAQQIQAIGNPLARINFAKSLGLDPAIAARFATASSGQMQQLIQDAKKAQQDDDAMKKKESMAKANAARWDEFVESLKAQILMPMMTLIGQLLPKVIPIFREAAKVMSKIVEIMAIVLQKAFPIFEKLFNAIVSVLNPILDMLTGKMNMVQGFTALGKAIGEIIKDAINGILGAVKSVWDTIKSPEFWMGMGSFMLNFVTAIHEGLKGALDELLTGIVGKILGAFGIDPSYTKTVVRTLTTIATGLLVFMAGKWVFGLIKGLFFTEKDAHTTAIEAFHSDYVRLQSGGKETGPNGGGITLGGVAKTIGLVMGAAGIASFLAPTLMGAAKKKMGEAGSNLSDMASNKFNQLTGNAPAQQKPAALMTPAEKKALADKQKALDEEQKLHDRKRQMDLNNLTAFAKSMTLKGQHDKKFAEANSELVKFSKTYSEEMAKLPANIKNVSDNMFTNNNSMVNALWGTLDSIFGAEGARGIMKKIYEWWGMISRGFSNGFLELRAVFSGFIDKIIVWVGDGLKGAGLVSDKLAKMDIFEKARLRMGEKSAKDEGFGKDINDAVYKERVADPAKYLAGKVSAGMTESQIKQMAKDSGLGLDKKALADLMVVAKKPSEDQIKRDMLTSEMNYRMNKHLEDANKKLDKGNAIAGGILAQGEKPVEIKHPDKDMLYGMKIGLA